MASSSQNSAQMRQTVPALDKQRLSIESTDRPGSPLENRPRKKACLESAITSSLAWLFIHQESRSIAERP